MKRTLFAIMLAFCVLLGACNPASTANESSSGQESFSSESVGGESSRETNSVVNESVFGHWKFQNDEAYYIGDIDMDDLRFIDLSGNGNDMVVEVEGYGDLLDTFTWDSGVSGDGSTSLRFNNTFTLAKSVDPYLKSQTTYSGAYVSGKYLKTCADAPMAFINGESEWTIEIVFKISSEWNNVYNRYTGIFSRQGVDGQKDEPYFSMAIAAADDSVGKLGTENPVDLQLVHINSLEQVTNSEFDLKIFAEKWVHYMVVGDGETITVYVNGQQAYSRLIDSSLAYSDFGWEVGVGRKYGELAQSMNERHPEGLIRRLFCGSISEIRFSAESLSVADSLWSQLND